MKKRSRDVALFAVALTLGVVLARQDPTPASAQQQPVGRIRVFTRAMEGADGRTPVMVSLIKDGKVIRQQEIGLGHYVAFEGLPAGAYDLRLEGDGLKTLVKHGIQALENQETNSECPMVPGTGVRIVEYAEGGMPREEVAARIYKLEAAVAEIQKKLPAQ